MSFREYLVESEYAAKLIELENKKRTELQSVHTARQQGNNDSVQYWSNAAKNTQKEIEKIKTAITKPKRADSKKASDEVEVVHGWKTNPEDKTISVTHAGETKTFNKKKDAIHHLLDKGLSAADVQRKGFSGLTVQGAKKSWKVPVVTAQKNAYRQEVKAKEEAEFANAKPIKFVNKGSYTAIDIEPLTDDLNNILKTLKPETQRLFVKFKPYNGKIHFGGYPSQGWINISDDKKGINIGYTTGGYNGIQHTIKIPLNITSDLKSSEVLSKIKKNLDSFFDEWEKKRSAAAKSFGDYLKRTGDYYG